MPSRKQRRRRQKERRHEYEFVYVDQEGHEVDADPVEEPEKSRDRDARRNGKRTPQKGKSGGRAPRKVDPPSWGRVARRALIFAPLIFVAFNFLSHNQTMATTLLLTALYTAFFIPFMYLMDRTMYRSYLRRRGQTPPPRTGRR
ncbi:MAG TPA: hypothetical protein VLU96_07575 [Gaiellaceae bacterium]|nr:hypothetical protein [Gaiellaceae bacterium]